MVEISVVIPVYNERENIKELVLGIQNRMSSFAPNHEIIVVDDGSNDGTLSVLTDLQKKVETLRILSHQSNCGQSVSLYNGIRASKGGIIVTLDGDGQNDPSDIPHMVADLRKNAGRNVQMVAGYRKKRNDNALRKISSYVANSVRRLLLKDDTPDTGCGLKVFSRDAFLSLPYFDHMHRFLPALIQRHGGKVISKEVNSLPRRYGVSKYGVWNRLWVGIVDLFGVIWLKKRFKKTNVTEIRGEEDE
jgi:dolichol-phosphate mannosyltransferase